MPWKILHLELSKAIHDLGIHPNYEKIYVVFCWHGVPLGHREIATSELPMTGRYIATLAADAIMPAVGNQHWPENFKAPLFSYFEKQPKQHADLQSLLALEQPLESLAQRWAQPRHGCNNQTVSVVICTRDRTDQLARCLDSMQHLLDPPDQLIVVDNAPRTSSTRQLVSQTASIRYVLEPRPGLSVARNTGILYATGNIIAFTDDDVTVDPGWITRLRQSFRDPRVMVVTGQVLAGSLETESQLIFEVELGYFRRGFSAKTFDQAFFRATRRRGVPVWLIGAGANMAFRREIFQLVGCFDERLGVGASGCSEDSELWYRILAEGWHCRYDPTVVVYHHHRQELDSLKQQMYQYTRGHVVALLIQFSRYRHWGNLFRLFVIIPAYYAKLFSAGLVKGIKLRHRTYLVEILGCLAGLKFYFEKRNVPSNSHL